jgi:hypothetical protein
MSSTDDRAYYQRREAAERNAAEKADPVAKLAHQSLADMYAARLREEYVVRAI